MPRKNENGWWSINGALREIDISSEYLSCWKRNALGSRSQSSRDRRGWRHWRV